MVDTNLTGIWSYSGSDEFRRMHGAALFFHIDDRLIMKGTMDRYQPRELVIQVAKSRVGPMRERRMSNLDSPIVWTAAGCFRDGVVSIDWQMAEKTGHSELTLAGDAALVGRWSSKDASGQERFTRTADLRDMMPAIERFVSSPHHVIFNNMTEHSDAIAELLRSSSYATNVFVMMRYGQLPEFQLIERVVVASLAEIGLTAHLARTRQLCDDLWDNVTAHMLGCRFGVAVFEKLCRAEFNPNVSMEVGFMYASGKACLLLKDREAVLPADICGKLYKDFDIRNIEASVRDCILQWWTELGVRHVK